MERRPEITCRMAVQGDALCLSVLATQVFLDTYATQGIRPAIAREARHYLSEEAFAALLADPRRGFLVAERADHLLGFAQLTHGQTHPLLPPGAQAAELSRLYVQRPFLGRGIGKELLARAETLAAGIKGAGFTVNFGPVDTIIENPNEGIDTVQSATSYTLGANVENLTLTGTAA